MNPNLQTDLKKYFGFSSFRPGQKEALDAILKRQHTLAVMPTGSGKSLIFQLAATYFPNVTLVISPLIALMKDQVDSLDKYGIPATFINSSLSSSEHSQRLRDISSRKYKIVYLAPERLRNARFLEVIKEVKVSLLAVDEAHCVSEWGHDFRPDYLQIANFKASVGDPVTIALTATATPQVQTDITRLLKLDKVKLIVNGFNRPNLVLTVRTVLDDEHRYSVLRDALLSQPKGATIIYTGTRRETEDVADFICSVMGIAARYYHAGLDAEQRNEIQNDFIQRKISVIVATNAFGMGIDRSDVRQVIHFSLPGSLEAYYQEAGRSGRDGMPAKALLLYFNKDRALQEYFIRTSEINKNELLKIFNALKPGINEEVLITNEGLSKLTGLNEVKLRVGLSKLEQEGIVDNFGYQGSYLNLKKNDWMDNRINEAMRRTNRQQDNKRQQLESMVEYAESDQCRRNIILHYFGDKSYVTVDVCCDNCISRKVVQKSNPVISSRMEQIDRPKDGFIDPSLIILETIQQVRNGVGSLKIAQILKGSKDKDLLISNLDKLPQYGKLSRLRTNSIRSLVEQLIKKEYIKVTGGQYPILRLSHAGVQALQAGTPIQLNTLRLDGKKKPARKKSDQPITGTVDQTFQLFSAGLTVDQIAEERELTVNTIYSHMVVLIKNGKLDVSKVLSGSMIKQIESAIVESRQVERLAPIKATLPEEIDFNQIRCVVENWKRYKLETKSPDPTIDQDQTKHRKNVIEFIVSSGNNMDESAIPELIGYLKSDIGNQRRLAASALGKIGNPDAAVPLMELIRIELEPQVRQYGVKALGITGDNSAISLLEKIESNQTEKEYVRKAATIAIKNIKYRIRTNRNQRSEQNLTNGTSADDSIRKFLAKDHPRSLTGPWEEGWALGFHSSFHGSEWKRSPVGELAFRLKYNADFSVMDDLVNKFQQIFNDHPNIVNVDAIMPVPSSIQREKDPVSILAKQLANHLKIAYLPDLSKSRKTEQQKQFQTLAQKKDNVAGAFQINSSIKGKKILVIDDLFDSGATLEEITKLLKRAGAAKVNILTITRTIHTEH